MGSVPGKAGSCSCTRLDPVPLTCRRRAQPAARVLAAALPLLYRPRAGSADSGPSLAKRGPVWAMRWPTSSNTGETSAKLGRMWPTFGKYCPVGCELTLFGQVRPRSARLDFSRCWSKSSQLWAPCAEHSPSSTEFGQIQATVRRPWATRGQTWPKPGQTWSNSDQLRPTSPKLGQPQADQLQGCRRRAEHLDGMWAARERRRFGTFRNIGQG